MYTVLGYTIMFIGYRYYYIKKKNFKSNACRFGGVFFRISKHDQEFKLSNFVSKNECIESSMHKHFELSEKKK